MLKFLVQCKFLFARVQWSLALDTSYSLEFINPNDWMSYKLWHLRNQCDIFFLFFFFFLGLPCKFLQGICFHTNAIVIENAYCVLGYVRCYLTCHGLDHLSITDNKTLWEEVVPQMIHSSVLKEGIVAPYIIAWQGSYGLIWYVCLKIENYCLKIFVKIRVGEKVYWNAWNVV